MNLVSIIGPIKKLDEFVNICGESGVFQPDNVSSFYSNTDNFSPISEENPYSSPLSKLKNSIYACTAKPEDAEISNFQVSRSKIDKYVNYFSEKVEFLVDKKREAQAKITKVNEEIEKLKHFHGLDKTLEDILSCEYIKARFGKIPIENYGRFEEISEECASRGIELLFFEFDSDNEYKWGLYFTQPENQEEIDMIFSKMQFQEITMNSYPKTPKEQTIFFESQIKELLKEIDESKNKIAEFWESQKDECMKYYKKIEKLSMYFEIKSFSSRYGNSFILVGWVPKDEIKSFTSKIESVKELEYSVEEGSDLLKNSPPVKLKNKKIFKPFEFFVRTYGMPSYNEIDPTVFVAITYPLLFGIMFADLGQGLFLALIGWIMIKFMNMKFGEVFIPCGLSSALFGLIFGSVFGFEHALDPIYKSIFGLKEKPIEVMEPSSSNMIIYSAVGIGILLLIMSMILGVYSMIKRKNIGEAVFGPNGICGLIFYISAIYMMLDLMVFKTGLVNSFYIVFLLILPLFIIMFKEVLIKLMEKRKDWQPESWADYISQSFFELFEILLSYVTNTMSFLRVGAFVLVHAGMMMVVFTIAEMAGQGIGYYLALIIGNIFVIALEALLSGIQVLRLEFYEMFSKFFEGQGREYSPVTANKAVR